MGLTFNKFQEISASRDDAICDALKEWSLSDWGVAVGEEAGEILGWMKKLRRFKQGNYVHNHLNSEEEFKEAICGEIADLISYLSLLATHLDVNLETIIAKKFNEVSDRYDCEIKL